MKKHFGIALLMVFFCLPFAKAQKDVHNLLNQMIKKVETINQAEFKIKSIERIGNQMMESSVHARVNTKPFKVYLKCIQPNEGVEILYVNGENNGKAIVNPNGFPYVNISMSPNAAKMRKDKHHSILSLGFHSGAELIKQAIKQNKKSESCVISDKGIVKKNGTEYRVVEIYNSDFGFEPITLERGMTAAQIASHYKINEYLVREKNNLKGFGTIKAGTVLSLPNHFAKKITLYVDSESMLPLIQVIEDEKGVFEKYEYSEIKINPPLPQNAFKKSCKEYNF